MNPIINIRLEAKNPERNHFRYYEMEVDKDLFDHWSLSVTFGRIGQAGTTTRFSSCDESDIVKRLASTLQRRGTAFQRIACRYQLVSLDYAPEPSVEAWISQLNVQQFDA